jgi:hypothetical protein
MQANLKVSVATHVRRRTLVRLPSKPRQTPQVGRHAVRSPGGHDSAGKLTDRMTARLLRSAQSVPEAKEVVPVNEQTWVLLLGVTVGQ